MISFLGNKLRGVDVDPQFLSSCMSTTLIGGFYFSFGGEGAVFLGRMLWKGEGTTLCQITSTQRLTKINIVYLNEFISSIVVVVFDWRMEEAGLRRAAVPPLRESRS